MKRIGVVAVLALAVGLLVPGTPRPAHAASAPPLTLRVVGAHLISSTNHWVQLRGANRSGTQYACISGDGFFDGPVDDASIAAMTAWHLNAVRVSLNEDCWLGINGAPAKYSGIYYQTAIHAFVGRLHAHGLYVILDLHWNAPGRAQATDQQAMPDRDHALAFWYSVGAVFRKDPATVFDLYNEPYPDGNHDTYVAWRCIHEGGRCPGVPFVAAGSQELVSVIRRAGARNVIMVAGPQYAGDLEHWVMWAPNDPLHQLAASVHVYGPDYSPCWQAACWNDAMSRLAARVPVVIGEMGDKDCTSKEITPLMNWADQHVVSYLAWAWFVGSCANEPSLISDYSGTPTPYGAGLKNHLA